MVAREVIGMEEAMVNQESVEAALVSARHLQLPAQILRREDDEDAMQEEVAVAVVAVVATAIASHPTAQHVPPILQHGYGAAETRVRASRMHSSRLLEPSKCKHAQTKQTRRGELALQPLTQTKMA